MRQGPATRIHLPQWQHSSFVVQTQARLEIPTFGTMAVATGNH